MTPRQKISESGAVTRNGLLVSSSPLTARRKLRQWSLPGFSNDGTFSSCAPTRTSVDEWESPCQTVPSARYISLPGLRGGSIRPSLAVDAGKSPLLSA